jgi:class 3 adenylate cyclase
MSIVEGLSRRQAEVLDLVGQHLSNPEISQRLALSVRTVESHVASLVRKLGVRDRRALVDYATALKSADSGGAYGAEAATRTFLFGDVVGSTGIWLAGSEDAARQLTEQLEVITAAVVGHEGRVFKTVGDGTCAVFTSVPQALRAAVDAQRRLQLSVRMAVHTGEAIERDGDFFGASLSRCARLMAAAHGRQVLVSATAAAVLAGESPLRGTSLRHLGEHQLRDCPVRRRCSSFGPPICRRSFRRCEPLEWPAATSLCHARLSSAASANNSCCARRSGTNSWSP